MIYDIKGNQLPVAVLTLNKGEIIHSERGAMSWMSESVIMKTNAGGSVGKAFSRMFSGESMFQNTYEATKDGDIIAFTSSFPGQIMVVDVENNTIIAQKRTFLAREASVDMTIHFQKKLGTAFFGGEGFIMQKFSGKGLVFLEIDGSLVEYELKEGESMLIDTGYLALMTESVKMDVQAIKGVSNALFGGEGLFNTKVTGPGKIWIQTMPLNKLAGLFSHD